MPIAPVVIGHDIILKIINNKTTDHTNRKENEKSGGEKYSGT